MKLVGKRSHVLLSTVVPLVLLLVIVPGAKCDLESQLGRGILNTIFDLPLRIIDGITQGVIAIGGIVKGEMPTTTAKLIMKQGYRQETHEVTTEDGYVLELFRIPYGPSTSNGNSSSDSDGHRIPVILFHGIGQTSSVWVLASEKASTDDALAFYLADRGFDVWLANQRGTPYSLRHIALNSGSSQFWDYTSHEVGLFDLAAIIDYVSLQTRHERVNFVGFSQANAAFLMLNANRPEYNRKVGVAVFLAPAFVFYDGFYNGLAAFVAPLGLDILEGLRSILGSMPIMPPFVTNFLHHVMPVVCSPTVDFFGVCLGLFKMQYGEDNGLITQDKLVIANSVMPVPTTLRNVIHIMQQIKYNDFTEFDYGAEKNRDLYHSNSPPRYNLTNVQAPVAIMVGAGDVIGSPMDARTLAKHLPNLVEYREVNYPYFTHADFILAEGAGKLVYSWVAQILGHFN